MAWGKKKQTTTPELSVEEQVVQLIEGILFSEKDGIKADKIDSSETIARNLAQILADQKERLSRLFDNDYTKFKDFMVSCVIAAKRHYESFLSNIKSTNVAVRDSIRTEARNVAEKFDSYIDTFLKTMTTEKINALNSEKTNAESAGSERLAEIAEHQKNNDAELLVQQFVEEYLTICAEGAKNNKTLFIPTTDSVYTGAQIEAFITANESSFKNKTLVTWFKSLPDAETKNKFAEAVHAQVEAHDKENEKEGTPADKEKAYIVKFNEAETSRARAEEVKLAAEKAKTEAEPVIEDYLTPIATRAGKTAELATEKAKGLLAAIDYVMTLTTDNEKRLTLAAMRNEYSKLTTDLTVAEAELKLLESRKAIENSRRSGYRAFVVYDEAEQARTAFTPAP